MKFAWSVILFLVLVPGFTSEGAAQDATAPPTSIETLRLQLLETVSKEADLQARAKQLDEDLKPENIERALAGIGSTRPEELRELRRRQLTIERDGVRTQLKLATTSRERLQSVISTAEARAYQQSAEGVNGQLGQTLMARGGSSWRWAVMIFAALGALALIALVMAVIKKQNLV